MTNTGLPVFFQELYCLWSTCRSLIDAEFIFIYGVRGCSDLILLQATVQFPQHHILKKLSFLLVISCFLCHKLIYLGVWFYFWAFYSVPSICVCFVLVSYCVDYCSFVVQSEVREHDTSSFVLFFSRLLWLFGVECFLVHENNKPLFLVFLT